MFGVMKEEKQGSMRVFRAEFGVSLFGLRERPGDPCCSGEKNPHCIMVALFQDSGLDVMG